MGAEKLCLTMNSRQIKKTGGGTFNTEQIDILTSANMNLTLLLSNPAGRHGGLMDNALAAIWIKWSM